MADFSKFIGPLQKREGLYSFDHAGDTVWGVAREKNPSWSGWAHANR